MSTFDGSIFAEDSDLPIESSADSNPAAPNDSRVRWIVAGGLILVGAVCITAKLLYPFSFVGHPAAGSLLHWLMPRIRRLVLEWSLPSMLLYPIAMLSIMVLERLFPAVPTQKTISRGIVNDALWILLDSAAALLVARWLAGFLSHIYTRHLSFLTLPMPHWVPAWARLVIGILVIDLIRWSQHWLHHNVSWLWPFHAVHHSQPELNLLSDYRMHFVNHFLRYTLTVLPMLMLGLQAPTIVWWLLILTWHTKFYHSNIKSNFGPLRYLIVTPQSHRVHHSKDPRHYSQNYGSNLSIWDHLFRTQHRHYDVYPETGIDDVNFPTETDDSLSSILISPLRQTIYPFKYLWNRRRTAQ